MRLFAQDDTRGRSPLVSAGEAQAVVAHALERDARMALHDNELAAGIGAARQLDEALEVIGAPHAGVLGKELRVMEVTGIPVDVIVEQVALELADAGVERILGPGDGAEPAHHPEAQRRHGLDRTALAMLARLSRELAM